MDRTRLRLLLWDIAFLMVGVLLGASIMPSFFYSADRLITDCNHNYGVGNWNVTKVGKDWTCTPISTSQNNLSIDGKTFTYIDYVDKP